MTLATAIMPPLTHLARLTTSRGLYEHALLDQPRAEHGHCVDDVARAVVVLCQKPALDRVASRLLDIYLNFTLAALVEDGACHNRMDVGGHWIDEPGIGDWWGRAIWALGFAAVHAPEKHQRASALVGFRVAARTTSNHLMSMTFAALGAGELLLVAPYEDQARRILLSAREMLALSPSSSDWIWPEPRLRYSNGSIPEATMIVGQALGDRSAIDLGVDMLEFLVGVETHKDHFSVTPVGGRGSDELEPSFDQQPIELAAIAGASARAFRITGRSRWRAEVERSWSWFLGLNDVGVQMFDPNTGAGYDGLQVDGPNFNQGAESTIAMLSTAQHAYRLGATA